MNRLKMEAPVQGQKVLEGLYADIRRRIGASPMGLCPVDMALNFLRTCHAQTCGKCVPCRIGLQQLTKMLESVLDGTADEETIRHIEKTAQVIVDTADCAIGTEAAQMVLRGVRGFRDDYMAHVTSGRCNYGLELSIPCTAVCPAHVDVPGYIALVKAGRYEDAVRLIRKDNPFPSVCGYVCEHPCEERCRRLIVDDAVNICGIKRYAVDNAGQIPLPECAEPTGKRVAVVGGGPAGLTAAYFLTLMGHKVTVYEARRRLGGMLRYGIPDYRLPEEILEKDIQYILDTGVEAKTRIDVGTDTTVDKLKTEYDAVYLSIGAHDDRKVGIPGEDGKNVVSAVGMLREVGKGKAPDLTGKRVCVVGGGNVAMDACRTSLRLGASRVTCVYRRRIMDMTALEEEIMEAQAEGVEMRPLMAPDHIELDEEGAVTAFYAQPQIISKVGSDGRPSVRKAEEAEPVRFDCDYVIVAIGQAIQTKHLVESGMRVNRGRIATDLSGYVPDSGNVFAGGDAVSGPATVIMAVAAGKVAADNIDAFLGYRHEIRTDIEVPEPFMTYAPACGRVNPGARGMEEISGDFSLVSGGMTHEEAMQECSRCLRCDHFGYGMFRGGRNTGW